MGKRFAIVIGVAALGAAVALSATALAGTDGGYHVYKGRVKEKDGGGKIRFSANLQRHRVRNARISNVNLVCDQGAVKYSRRMHPRKKRLGRHEGNLAFGFSDTIEHGTSKLKVFVLGVLLKSHHYRKAVGLIHTSGDLNASQTDCRVDGLPLNRGARWRAHRH